MPISYRRFDHDVLAPRNIVAVVEMARGEWCWLLSSDDAIAPGAIPRVLDLLRAHPDATGLSVDRVNMDRELQGPVDQDPPRFAPSEDGVEVWRSPDEILGRLGSLFRYLSSHIVRRAAWREAVEQQPPWEVTRFFPQLVTLARMAQRNPVWIWVGSKLVLNRTHNLAVHEYIGSEEERIHTVLTADAEACWAAIAGRGTPLYRDMTALDLELTAPADVLRSLKRRSDRPWRTDVRLLISLTRTFWRHRRFWLARLPVLLTPAVVERRRAARTQAVPSPPLPPDACRARLAAVLPRAVRQRHQTIVACQVENTGSAVLASAPPNPVFVSYRWTDPHTDEPVLDGIREALPRPLAPGASVGVPVRILAPWDTGTATLRLSLVQEWVAWWDDLDPEHGLVAHVDVTA
jgi:hypothetical protein